MRRVPAFLFLAVLSAAGCSKAPAPEVVAEHHAAPPHGGTAVELGDGKYHLELVLDAAQGLLQGYVLDDDMENFIHSSSPAIPLALDAEGSHVDLVLAAVANTFTGETVGDSALFEVRSDWLKVHPTFDGRIGPLAIRGTSYPAVPVHFRDMPRAAP